VKYSLADLRRHQDWRRSRTHLLSYNQPITKRPRSPPQRVDGAERQRRSGYLATLDNTRAAAPRPTRTSKPRPRSARGAPEDINKSDAPDDQKAATWLCREDRVPQSGSFYLATTTFEVRSHHFPGSRARRPKARAATAWPRRPDAGAVSRMDAETSRSGMGKRGPRLSLGASPSKLREDTGAQVPHWELAVNSHTRRDMYLSFVNDFPGCAGAASRRETTSLSTSTTRLGRSVESGGSEGPKGASYDTACTAPGRWSPTS